MVRSGENNETTIRKLGGMMLGHHWDAVFNQVQDKAVLAHQVECWLGRVTG